MVSSYPQRIHRVNSDQRRCVELDDGTIIEWCKPPLPRSGGIRKKSKYNTGTWQRVADVLIEHPKKWAHVFRTDSQDRARGVKHRMKLAGCEAVIRKVTATKIDVYARYVGDVR